jgi:hypothetical protein
MSAVFFGSHMTLFSTTVKLSAVLVRERRVSGNAFCCAEACNVMSKEPNAVFRRNSVPNRFMGLGYGLKWRRRPEPITRSTRTIWGKQIEAGLHGTKQRSSRRNSKTCNGGRNNRVLPCAEVPPGLFAEKNLQLLVAPETAFASMRAPFGPRPSAAGFRRDGDELSARSEMKQK